MTALVVTSESPGAGPFLMGSVDSVSDLALRDVWWIKAPADACVCLGQLLSGLEECM